MIIRLYAEDHSWWDDGVGNIVIAESMDIIEKYVQHVTFNQHPYQDFEYDSSYKQTDTIRYLYGKITKPRLIHDAE